jgi:hypothetical protein
MGSQVSATAREQLVRAYDQINVALMSGYAGDQDAAHDKLACAAKNLRHARNCSGSVWSEYLDAKLATAVRIIAEAADIDFNAEYIRAGLNALTDVIALGCPMEAMCTR